MKALLLVLLLLLAGCSSKVISDEVGIIDDPENMSVQNETMLSEDPVPEESDEPTDIDLKEDVLADIVIEKGSLTPRIFNVSVNEEILLTIQNKDNYSNTFEIPIYNTEILQVIDPGRYVTVKFNPVNKGTVSMYLNGHSVGSLIIK